MILPKVERILIQRSASMIPPNIALWQHDLARTSEYRSDPFGRSPYGCLVIPRLRSWTQSGRSRMRVRLVRPLH